MSNLYTAQSGWWFMCSTKDTGYYLTPTPFILRVGKSCHDAIWMYNLQLDKPSANKEKEGIALSLLMCSLVVAYISTSVSFYITWPPQTLCSQCCTMFSVALEELCQVCQVTWVNSVKFKVWILRNMRYTLEVWGLKDVGVYQFTRQEGSDKRCYRVVSWEV